MRSLELDQYSAIELSGFEEKTINGGLLLVSPWVVRGAEFAVGFVIDQWDDIKNGWNDSASGKPYNYK